MPFWAAAAAVVGSVIGSNSASDAADSQAQSSAAAIAEQRRQYDQTREDYTPYRDAGRTALGQLATENNAPINPADVMREPGYRFGMEQGQLGLDRKAAAAGGRVSGAALKAASQFSTDYASTGYGAAYQRRQDRLNRLASLAGIGQTATSGSALAGSQSSNAISGLLSNQGDNAGSARLMQGNIWGNAANQIGALYGRRGSNANPLLNSGNSYTSGGNVYGNFDLSGTNRGSGD